MNNILSDLYYRLVYRCFCVGVLFLVFVGVSGCLTCSFSASPTISFYGAAGCLTGSCHLLDTGYERVLLDCGSFMETSYLENNLGFPFPASSIDTVVLSHAHLDHSGRIPLLFNKGFTGEVLCARPTREICEIMFNLQGFISLTNSKTLPFSKYDRRASLSHFRELPYSKEYSLSTGSTVTLYPAQHILGSSMIKIDFRNTGKELRLNDFFLP